MTKPRMSDGLKGLVNVAIDAQLRLTKELNQRYPNDADRAADMAAMSTVVFMDQFIEHYYGDIDAASFTSKLCRRPQSKGQGPDTGSEE